MDRSKAAVVKFLKSQHGITTTQKTLNKILSYMGVERQKLSDSDIEKVLESIELLNQFGNKEGYIKIAEKFGVNLNTLSTTARTPTHHKSTPTDKEEEEDIWLGDIADEVIEREYYATMEKRMEHFMRSKKPYEIVVDLIKSKRELLFQTMDAHLATNIRVVEQVPEKSLEGNGTIDIPAEEIEAPDNDDPDRSVSDADFHNQDSHESNEEQ